MRIVVTGGGGFIGKEVVNALQADRHTVSTYDLRDGRDIMNRTGISDFCKGTDVVIHLAGVLGTHELFDEPHTAIDVNIHGTMNVIEACHENGAAYVGITMPVVFPSVYTATKVAAQRLAEAWHHSYGLRVAHVEAYNAFGPGQAYGPKHPQKIIPTFAMAVKNREPIPIWGDGSQTVDLIHTTDLARVFVRAVRELNTKPNQILQGGSGIAFTVVKVAEIVSQMMGQFEHTVKFSPMRRGETPTDIVAKDPALDVKVTELWGQLEDTVKWYKENGRNA